MAGCRPKLGPTDRSTVSDYLDVLREVERRIQQTEAKNAESPLPEYDRPGIGVPERFDDHAKLMFDLQHLAFQGDITRVTTFMYGAEQRARMYPEIGLNESHHSMSHHGDNPENLAKYTKLCTWHVELFAYLVDKMRNTPDGDGTLLDHSLLMIGGGMSNGNIHSHMDVPIALRRRRRRHARQPPRGDARWARRCRTCCVAVSRRARASRSTASATAPGRSTSTPSPATPASDGRAAPNGGAGEGRSFRRTFRRGGSSGSPSTSGEPSICTNRW